MQKDKWWLPFITVGLIVLSIGAVVYYNQPRQSEKSVSSSSSIKSAMGMIGVDFPNFTVIDQEGMEKKSSEFYDKPMLVIEWASWCPHCHEQLPIVQKLYEKYGDKVHFVMLDLSDDKKEPKEKADSYIKKNGFTFPYYYDKGQIAADALQVESIPSIYIVDKSHKIKNVFVEEQDEKILEKEIEAII